MSQEERLTVDDAIRAGGCPAGIRRWFTANEGNLPEGVTLKGFLREGVPLEVARTIDDAFVQRAIALKEAGNGR